MEKVSILESEKELGELHLATTEGAVSKNNDSDACKKEE